MSNFTPPTFTKALLHPRYWLTLFFVGLMYVISWLPYFIQYRMGQGIGRLAMRFMKKRRRIIDRNLELCFPNMSKDEREVMIKKNIDNTGLALFESGMAWFWPDIRVNRHVEIKGLEHMKKLEAEGKGALLVAVHSMNLELGARAFGIKMSGTGVYRPNGNPCYDFFQYRGRARSNRTLIDRKDVKGMLRALRRGDRVWYAPDHDYGRRRSTFAPLFAVDNACTTTGTSLLVDATDCAVVPFTMVRDSASGKYTLTMYPPVEGFPNKNPEEGAAFINKIVENSIMQAPEQYMWLHRRFKTRPEGEACLYTQ